MRGETMNVQTIELAGQKFVILPESEFRELERQSHTNGHAALGETASGKHRFEPVVPFDVSGESASEMLVRERK